MGQQKRGFQQTGLARPVGPEKKIPARLQIELEPLNQTQVGYTKTVQLHVDSHACNTAINACPGDTAFRDAAA